MPGPGLPCCQSAPPAPYDIYRDLRQPNYSGIILEIVAAPLLHSAYVTAVAFSVATLLLLILSARIRTEDRALLDAFSSPPR